MPPSAFPSRPQSAIVITPEEAFRVPQAALIAPTPRIHIRPSEGVPVNGWAIASLAFGIVGLPVLGILTGWFAVWFGAMALRRTGGPRQYRGRGLATAGIVLGVADILIWIVLSAIYGSALFTPHFGKVSV